MSIFSKIRVKSPKKSAMNLSHERKFSCNMGELVPIFCEEVVPGDNFQVRLEQLVRFQALKSPMMHRVDVSTHFFFVPNRLVWNEWEDFITGGENGNKEPLFPTYRLLPAHKEHFQVGGILDHFGIPVQQLQEYSTFDPVEINALPIRAYQLIYNEYFRDQNVTPKLNLRTGSGTTNFTPPSVGIPSGDCLKRAWRKDYFTSALPWAQRGASSLIPFTDTAPVHANDRKLRLSSKQGNNYSVEAYPATSVTDLTGEDLVAGGLGGTTINELRRAYKLQEWLEKNARGGARYIEQIFSHFGVKSSDARLQRPEYIGGGRTPVMLSEVLQQSETTQNSPQGNMAGHGVSAGSSPYFKKYFEEHGFIIGIMSVMPEPSYMQGLPKKFTKFDKFDYYFPEFQHLGEQPISNSELYLNSNQEINKSTFGYTPRYAEYRYVPSTVHGDMRTSLKFWHMANDYEESPNLNTAFIEADPTHRVFAVEDKSYDKLIIQTYADVKAIRPMSKYATPY